MNRVAASLIILGGVILLISLWMWNRETTGVRQTSVIGRVIRETGDLKIRHAQGFPQNVVEMEPLLAGDELETNEFGEASVQLDSGISFRVLLGTYLALPTDTHRSGVLVKRGRIHFENPESAVSFDIQAEGKSFSPIDYEKFIASKSELGVPGTPNAREQIKPSGKNILSEVEIQQTLSQYKSLFFRCYAQAVQKNASAKGHANLIFTLENNGKVKFAEVNQSEIDDVQFKSCLVEAVKRIPFRNAPTDSLTINYPLDFK